MNERYYVNEAGNPCSVIFDTFWEAVEYAETVEGECEIIHYVEEVRLRAVETYDKRGYLK